MSGIKTYPLYRKEVLIGNWFEERVDKQPVKLLKTKSQYQNDFCLRDLGDPRYGDLFIRRKCTKSGQGYGKEILLEHGNGCLSNSMRTIYDIDFTPKNLLVDQSRQWDSKDMKWVPEKIDVPINGESKNWGLSKKILNNDHNAVPSMWNYENRSTYQDSYKNTD